MLGAPLRYSKTRARLDGFLRLATLVAPTHRGLVLVDAVDGEILECLVEINPDNAATTK